MDAGYNVTHIDFYVQMHVTVVRGIPLLHIYSPLSSDFDSLSTVFGFTVVQNNRNLVCSDTLPQPGVCTLTS